MTWAGTKQWTLDMAELCDAWRIFPRVVLSSYGYMCWHLTLWYEALPNPTTEQSGFAGAIIGLAVPLTGWYMSTGRVWSK